jgi:hypothetical protein
MAPARLFHRSSRIAPLGLSGSEYDSSAQRAPSPACSLRGRTGMAAYLMGSGSGLYSVLSIASALETANSPGFSTLSALTTPFSTSIA